MSDGLTSLTPLFGCDLRPNKWVIYEWGTHSGGCNVGDSYWCLYIGRAFEREFFMIEHCLTGCLNTFKELINFITVDIQVVMCMAIVTNVWMAMFASFLWLVSLVFTGSHRSFTFRARNMLAFIITLLSGVFVLVFLGLILGIVSKFAPYWIEVVTATSFSTVIVAYGIHALSHLISEEMPLEYFHFPTWFKCLLPFPIMEWGGRQKIVEAAQNRATELKQKASEERTMLDPNAPAKKWNSDRLTLHSLLRHAADSIGRVDSDILGYVTCLEKDWYTTIDLHRMSIETLSKYMPRKLAEEVHRFLEMGELN